MVYSFNPNANLTNMPNMANTLTSWEAPLELIKLSQVMSEGDVSYSEQTITFQGVWQSLKDEQLQFKPEGQRSWSWYWIHAKAGTLNLNTADKIIFNGERYKVMEKKDYSLNGFVEYHVVKDFE